MNKIFPFFIFILFNSSCSTRYYITRHAEKLINESKDPELSEIGKTRALKLDSLLSKESISEIYSTQTIRTISTVKLIADKRNVEIKIYDPKNQSAFIETLKRNKQNSLIVGHSNTIRYVINGLAEKEALVKDLDDLEYNKLFVVHRFKIRKPKFKIIEY